MSSNSWSHIIRISLAALVCGVGISASAQVQPRYTAEDHFTPKVEMFGGYSYFDPGTALHGTLPGGTLPFSECLCSIPRGAGAGISYNFNSWFGLTIDGSGNWGAHGVTEPVRIDRSSFYSVAIGPTLTYRGHRLAPFFHGLVGGQRLTPELFHPSDTFGFLAGGGLDWNLGRHFGVRIAQADFAYSNHQFGPSPTAPTDIRGLRLESGLIFKFGGAPRIAAQTQREQPLAEPIAAPIAAAAPEKVLAPLSMTCSAVPSMVSPGAVSTISAIAISPGNRPLRYTYVTTAGSISGSGSTVILATEGASPGLVSVTCTAADDMGQSASQVAIVRITSPVALARPVTSNLCSISFERDKARPARVNNEAKACLDEVAMSLQQNSNATLALVGNAAGSQANGRALASRRATNAKAYLVTEKGIDSARIDLFTGTQDNNGVSATMIPPGASFDSAGDAPLKR